MGVSAVVIPSAQWRAALAVGLCAGALAWALHVSGGDAWLADLVYRWEGGRWALRDAWWTSALLHEGGRRLSILCWIGVCAAWVCAARGATCAAWRQPLGYLLVAVLTSTLLVSTVKHASGIDCPWDLQRYGGTRPEGLWFGVLSAGDAARGACFPAGHASAGYAWVAAWFAFAPLRPAWRIPALGLALAAGAAFGIAQQLRGAHFLSHDLGTLALCALVAGALARIWPWQIGRAAIPSFEAVGNDGSTTAGVPR